MKINLDLLYSAMAFMSKDDMRESIKRVLIREHKGRETYIGTDGRMICFLSQDSADRDFEGVQLPAEICQEIKSICESKKRVECVASMSEDKLSVSVRINFGKTSVKLESREICSFPSVDKVDVDREAQGMISKFDLNLFSQATSQISKFGTKKSPVLFKATQRDELSPVRVEVEHKKNSLGHFLLLPVRSDS